MRSPDDVARELEAFPEVVAALFGSIDERVLRARPATGEWSPVEVLIHLIDCDRPAFEDRIETIVTGGGRLRGSDPWAAIRARIDDVSSIDSLLDEFRASRRRAAAFVRSLEPTTLDRAGRFRDGRQFLAADFVAEWSLHDQDHLQQILDATKRAAHPAFSTEMADALMLPVRAADHVAWISEADMVEVDRVMIEDLHIELIQMMEQAGRHLARLVRDRHDPRSIAVFAGSGGNGGGGLVAARHLRNAGLDVRVWTTREIDAMAPVPAHQLEILRRLGVEPETGPVSLERVDVVIDAVIGYSLRGAPTGRSAEFIDAMSDACPIVSLDVPSGLDVTTGEAPGAVVYADATLTLAMPKVGLRRAPEVGELFLADISVPPHVAERFGRAPRFGSDGLLRIRRDDEIGAMG